LFDQRQYSIGANSNCGQIQDMHLLRAWNSDAQQLVMDRVQGVKPLVHGHLQDGRGRVSVFRWTRGAKVTVVNYSEIAAGETRWVSK
jgi:hypothetical protein